jgi:hypothetical protein
LNLNPINNIFRSSKLRLSYLLVILAILHCSNFYSQIKNEDDLKKQAEKHFEEEDYNLAYKLFAQLVSLYPKDPDYNYKLGVCMIYTEPDKKKPYSYLQIAANNTADAPKDAKFYLAKTYHINYRFDEAIKLYVEYKKIGSAAAIKKLQVDREIQACKNGKRLLSDLSDLVVINKKQLSEADYFKGYDVKDIGGKLLVKPDDYKTAIDIKKKDKSVVYLPRNAERLYYSSYGEDGKNGRDIYFVNKLPNGGWGKPQILPATINTEYDEDYPFLHPNGKTLYFSSKGHNSMGGYDVFKTTFDDATQAWSKPINLEFPINSPDDDILFVTDSLEKTAFFSTGRYSPFGRLDVLKINTERRPMNFAVMKGSVLKEEASQSIKSKITVKNMADGQIVGAFQAGDNGDYNMELPNGGKFIFTVETPGIPTQSDGVQIPVAYSLKPYKQVISYDNKILKIINYFDSAIDDENYSMMIDLIEKKAKLEVNENEPYNTSLNKDANKNNTQEDVNKKLNAVGTNNPTVSSNETNLTAANNTNKNVTNEQLLSIAKVDAKEATDEAKKLKQEAQEAFGLATQKTAESVEKQKEADQAFEKANSITDITLKNEELAKINQLKEDAKMASDVANTATNLAKKLEVDANVQQKEADLTNQYIAQLETVIKNKNNKEALTKLEGIQKELDELSKQKNQSDELFNSLKAESELKQKELTNSETKSKSIVNEINAIKNESESLQKDLANENDKSIKENISAQIRELTNEIDLKNKDLTTNNQKNEVLKNEVRSINQEIQIAAKILNESTEGIVVLNNESINPNENVTDANENKATNSNTTTIDENSTSNVISYQEIKNNYNQKLNSKPIDKTNIDDVSQQNEVFKNYNKEVNDLIVIDKNELSKTNNATENKKLNEEINNLEKLKIENDNAIVLNNNKIKQLESNSIAINKTNNTSNNATEDANKLTNLNDANKNNTKNNSEELINEAEKLSNIAYEQRKTAATKTGSEKEALIKQATENEQLATDKKLEVAINNQNENKSKFENNSFNLTELQKLTINKTSTEISQANTLINEAATNFNQAQKIRTETNKYALEAAKLGGFSNAEEKENEALVKQTKALEILLKTNPEYIPKLNNTEVKKEEQIAKNTNTVSGSLNETNNVSNNASNNETNNASNNDEKINNTTSGSIEVIKQIDPSLGNDKTAILKELNILKNELNSNTIASGQVFNNSAYVESTSKELKQIADQKYEAAKQSELNLNNTIAKTETAIKNSNNGNSQDIFNEAEELNNKAFEQRKESATKTGAEKNDLITQALENERLSIDKKLAASILAQQENKTKFENNNSNLIELQKLLGTKTSNEISQANMLVDEAVINFNQAQKTRLEAEAYPSGSARLGGLSNSEDKEKEALAKQQIALEFLSKENPTYKIKSSDAEKNPDDALANLNTEILKNSQAQLEAYLALSNINQNELKLQNDKLVKNPAFKNTANKQAQDLKINSDNLNNEAKAFIAQSLVAKSTSEKATLLLKGNEKEIAAIKTLAQASDFINGNSKPIATNISTVVVENKNPTEVLNETATNTTANKNINSTITNSVAANNENANNKKAEEINNNASNPSSNEGNGISAEALKLKENLNNSNENTLVNYKSYTNSEAIGLKDKAAEKINIALIQDKQIESALDNVSQLASNFSAGVPLDKNSISTLLGEADKLNDDAYALRKSAATKAGTEKDNDINNAKTLEANAISKKIEAANKQKQLNNANYKANLQSLEDLAELAKGKNIADLSSVDMLTNEANLFLQQAQKLREEANAYPNEGAKLGGFSNAEEKEFQALFKQQTILDIYKKHFPNYVPKTAIVSSENPEAITKLNETKINLNNNNQLHIEGLNLLAQATVKEYKNRFIALPEKLNPEQINLKIKAQDSYKKNQALQTQANEATDLNLKKNVLVDVNLSGQEAISLLNQITDSFNVSKNALDVVNKNSIDTPTNVNDKNLNTNATTDTTTVTKTATTATSTNVNNLTDAINTSNVNTNNPIVKIKVEGLEVKNNNAYTADKPIPIDEKIPDGLVFKVQIGAFKTPLPNNTFKGLSPVIAQTTPSGYIRYMAGNFEQYTSANAVKNDLRNLGYSDAFVVAYYNGVRIKLNEATDKAKALGQTIEPATNTSAGITANSNVPKNTFITPTNNTAINNGSDFQPAAITNELEKMNGLLYTVQIGVYSNQVTREQLFKLKPIYSERLPNGLYRYTAGIYNQSGKLLEDKRKVVNLGVKDAFVSAYYNAKRITYAEGQKLQTDNISLKMEAENPIIFDDALNNNVVNINTAAVVDNNNPVQANNKTNPEVTPFSNGVATEPTPTPENGVKANDAGISYKVQIGAYTNQVPNDVANKFLNIKTWPVKNVTINDLFIYSIGNFNAMNFAKKLKEEAISFGILDAFITVYKDGKKLYGAEASQYLNNTK